MWHPLSGSIYLDTPCPLASTTSPLSHSNSLCTTPTSTPFTPPPSPFPRHPPPSCTSCTAYLTDYLTAPRHILALLITLTLLFTYYRRDLAQLLLYWLARILRLNPYPWMIPDVLRPRAGDYVPDPDPNPEHNRANPNPNPDTDTEGTCTKGNRKRGKGKSIRKRPLTTPSRYWPTLHALHPLQPPNYHTLIHLLLTYLLTFFLLCFLPLEAGLWVLSLYNATLGTAVRIYLRVAVICTAFRYTLRLAKLAWRVGWVLLDGVREVGREAGREWMGVVRENWRLVWAGWGVWFGWVVVKGVVGVVVAGTRGGVEEGWVVEGGLLVVAGVVYRVGDLVRDVVRWVA